MRYHVATQGERDRLARGRETIARKRADGSLKWTGKSLGESEPGVTPSPGRNFRCPNCGETLSWPARSYECPKGRKGWIDTRGLR